MSYPIPDELAEFVNSIVDTCHGSSKQAGWWPESQEDWPDNVVPQKLCLIHSEISEAMEGDRKGLQDDHLPDRSMIEVELADAVIRIADLAGALKLDLGGALVEKMRYNQQRADHKKEAREAEGGKSY
jgi:NTP pyrophosphatase (non-canonical NTP hydrolase)